MNSNVKEFVRIAEESGKNVKKEQLSRLRALLMQTEIEQKDIDSILNGFSNLKLNYAIQLLADKWSNIKPELKNYFLRWLYDGDNTVIVRKCILMAAYLPKYSLALDMIEKALYISKGKKNEDILSTIRSSWLIKSNDQLFPFESFDVANLLPAKRLSFISLLYEAATSIKSGGNLRKQKEELFTTFSLWIFNLLSLQTLSSEERAKYEEYCQKLDPKYKQENTPISEGVLSQNLTPLSTTKEIESINSQNENTKQKNMITAKDHSGPQNQHSKYIQKLISENELTNFFKEFVEEITRMKKGVQGVSFVSDKTTQQLKRDLSLACSASDHLKEQSLLAAKEFRTEIRKMHSQLEEMAKEKERIQNERDVIADKLQQIQNELEQIRKKSESQKTQSLIHTENVIQHELQMRSSEIAKATSHIIKDFENWKKTPDLPDPVAYLTGLFDSLLGVLARYSMVVDKEN